MSAPAPTAEQRAAIERREGSLFLSAGAGSGKTRVLVERFVASVLEDGVEVERILAITFTEKAAAELKSRIRRAFLDRDEREHARAAEAAWVSTIHGFCSRILRAHALAAGIDPEYRVLDEAEAARLSIDGFDAALEDFLARAGRDERLDLVARYTPDKVQRMVATVYSRLRSQGQSEPELPPVPRPRPDGVRARLEAALRAARAELDGVDASGHVAKALVKMDECDRALAALGAEELGEADVFEDLFVRRGNAVALRGPAFDELQEAFDAFVAACTARRAHADYLLLGRLLTAYGRRYSELKEARAALDFEDLELRTRDLLRARPALAARTRERFQRVMVDEFQDTNQLQNDLLDLICDGNLFAVGDELQSIYGFRNADVEVFRRRRDTADAAGEAIRLATNFRSRPELLDVIDLAFEGVFEDAFTPLVAPQGADAAPAPAPLVDLLIVDKSKRRFEEALGEDAFGPAQRGVPPWRAAEARLLGRRVSELLDEGYRAGDVAVLLRSARDLDVYERALSERGIPTYAVGGRGYWSHQQIADLRAYLAALANPQDELALYDVLASPMVGVSLDALAIVRMRARSQHRDAWWALEEAFGDGGDGSEELAVALPAEDREPIAEFVRRFAAERRAAPRRSLATLVDRAVTGSGYDRAVLAMRGGARRMANVRKLMRLAREFEQESGRDLRRFLDFVDERELLKAREGEAPIEGEGFEAVRLMTIHAAKGLEFPVVCVADLGREGKSDDTALRVSQDGRAGLRVASLAGGRHKALGYDEMENEQERAAEAEERRIFHVAMTRARERLVVSGAVDVAKWSDPKPLGPPLDWVWRALAPDARTLFEAVPEGELGRPGPNGTDARVRCVLLTAETVDRVLSAADRRPAGDSAADGGEPTTAPERPDFRAVEVARALPVARLSYSALESYKRCGYRFYVERVVGMRAAEPVPAPAADAEPDGGGQLALATPESGEEEAVELSPLLRGSIVHELLEHLDFARPAGPAPDVVEERLRSNGVEPTEAAVEDVRALIDGFARSELCARLGAAGGVRRELPFAFPLEPGGPRGRSLLVNGVLDVHATEGERALVVDYKTDALDGRPPAEVTAEKYATQRIVYALAALRSGAPAVEVAYAFLDRPDEPVSATWMADDEAPLEAELLALAAGVVEGRFAPTTEPHRELCHRCPAQPALCTWGPDRTMADRPEGETIGGVEPIDVREGLAAPPPSDSGDTLAR